MKKLLAALLALLCLPVMTALGDTQGDFTYALTPEGAVVTMYYVEDAAQTPAVITVPDALGGQPVVGIGENAFNNSESAFDGGLVEAIILPGTLRYLDDGAFTCCHDVKKLYFPASLERIAEGCFSHVTAEIALDPDNPYFTVERGYLIDRRAGTLLYAPRLRAGDAIDLPPGRGCAGEPVLRGHCADHPRQRAKHRWRGVGKPAVSARADHSGFCYGAGAEQLMQHESCFVGASRQREAYSGIPVRKRGADRAYAGGGH